MAAGTVRNRFLQAALACLVAVLPMYVSANPSGGIIKNGQITITPGGNTLTIEQLSNRGIIEWNSFSIANGETTEFIQPNSTAATLNRVTGGSSSFIDGNLFANGRVFLINSNGILIGTNGVIDVGGFTASTLDVSDTEFLAGGDLQFAGPSQATVVNLGSISAVDGDVFLVAASVQNTGSINAPNGTVGLAAGNDVLIKGSGHERVFVRGASGGTKPDGVLNQGTIDANIAELKAHGGNIYGMAVRNEGRVAATAVSQEGGQIFLRAGGGRVRTTGQLVAKRPSEPGGGNVVVDSGTGTEAITEIGGTVDAASETGTGGAILILGNSIDLFAESLILADGDVGGGSILVGGSREGLDLSFARASDVVVGNSVLLSASATGTGSGGEIVLSASGSLDFDGFASALGGAVSGDGGFVELTGKESVIFSGLNQTVDVSATDGTDGTLLIDSSEFSILAGDVPDVEGIFVRSTNTLFADDLSAFLNNTGSLRIESEFSPMAIESAGDITMFTGAEIDWSAGNSLSIHSARDFRMEYGAFINSSGGGTVDLIGDRAVRIGGDFGSNPSILPTTEPLTGVYSGGDIKIGNPDTPDSEGVELSYAGIGSSGGSVSIDGYVGSSEPLFTAALHIENSEIEGYTDVSLKGFDRTSSGHLATRVGDSSIFTQTGTVSIEGSSAEGSGLVLGSSVIDGNGGDVHLSGMTSGTETGDIGISVFQPETSPEAPYISTSSDGTIHLSGGTGAADGYAIMFNASPEETEFDFIGGDGTQDVDVVGNGGDVFLSRVFADELSFNLSPMASGDFILTNSQINFFETGNAGHVSVTNLSDLEIGNMSVSDATVVLESGNLSVTGQIDSAGALGFFGNGMDQVFRFETPLTAPSIQFDGSESGLKVETTGTVELDRFTFTDVIEVRGIGSGNNFLIGASTDESIALTTLTEAGSGEGSIMTTQAEIGGLPFVAFDDISGGAGNDTFHVMLDDDYTFFGDLLGEEGDDRFVIYEGGSLDYLDGGSGYNTLAFSPFASSTWVNVGNSAARQVSSFDGISSFVGGGSRTDAFLGTEFEDLFTLTSNGGGTLQFDSGESVSNFDFSGFEGIFGRGGADTFDVQLPGEVNFQGGLLGGSGDDLFLVGTLGSVNSINGGGGVDTLDFHSFLDPVTVDLQNRSATNVGAFFDIEKFQGGQSAGDRFQGTVRNDRFDILNDSEGTVTVPSLTGGMETVYEFSSFESIGGAAGNDLFVVSNPGISPFLMYLGGDEGNDIFQMIPGGGVAAIDGGMDFDTIDYSLFTTPVMADFRMNSATQVGSLSNMEKIIGGGAEDTLIGTDNADVFRIESENGGKLNAGIFESFEFLRGAGGNDQFLFSNQATVAGIFGGGGVDSLQIDDRDLGGTNTYVIGEDSISRNPTYTFNGLETLSLRLGPGNDTVVTSGNGLIQFINAGDGTDYLDLGDGNFITSNPIMIGGSKIYLSGFDGPYPPPDDSDILLTQQSGNRPSSGGPSNGATLDQFSSSGVMGDFTGGNAFAASAAASAIVQQAIVLQADGSQTLLQAPLSLDGTFTLPPEGVIQYLEENLEPDVWAELADAIDFEGAYLMIMTDGPQIIDLSEATPADIAAILASNLLAEAAVELLDALELAIVIPVTSLDGAVAIVTVPVPVDADMVALLTQLLADDALAELTQALETE